MNKLLLLLLLPSHLLLGEEPWGKDADLLQKFSATDCKRESAGFETIIGFHQKVISLADGPRSHFKPSSSSYALQSIQKHGFLKGFTMGCDRLLRENSEEGNYLLYKTRDGDYLKWDPVK